MIRPTDVADTPVLLEFSRGTQVFKPLEIQALDEVLTDYHAANRELGHQAVSYVEDGAVSAFAYFAPAAMTDGTWYLYWIVVARALHGRGIGAKLLAHAERAIRQQSGRLLLIETSSQPHYEPTRRFYTRRGYTQAAVIRDYYSDGDDMVVFGKRLA